MVAHKQFSLRLVACFVMMFSISWSGLSSAEDLSDFCAQAQSFLDQNQPVKAMGVFRKAIEAVWARTPFHVEKAVLVQEKAPGYGMYVLRSDNTYKSGETVRVYLEPVGFVQQEKDGRFFIDLAADFTVRKDDGTIIGGKDNFGKWEIKNGRFITEFYVNLDYHFTNFQPGDYIIKTVLRDLASSKTTTVETPVRIE